MTPAPFISINDLLPGELFSFEDDPRVVRCVQLLPSDEKAFARIVIGSLGNDQQNREAVFLASTRVIPATSK